jgi:transcriptional regulator MftR-like protein
MACFVSEVTALVSRRPRLVISGDPAALGHIAEQYQPEAGQVDFADKREVLFDAAAEPEEKSLAALEAAPATASTLEVVTAALDAVADTIGHDREPARKRHAVIMANADLRERELIKLARMSATLADGLRRRGVGDAEAALATEAGAAVYRVAFQQWVDATDDLDLRDAIDRSFAQLRTLTAPG